MTTGIYKIENLNNGKIYIGQSINVERRIREHRNDLNRGDHHNIHLQSVWNKYGQDSFVFSRIRACPKLFLDPFERLYICNYKSMDPKHGYNLESGGNVNKTTSPETRAKQSKALSGENNPFYGKHHSEKTIEKVSGPNNYAWKDYPRIIKCGKTPNGKQNYAIYKDGKRICYSIDLEKLEQKLENMKKIIN